MNIESTLNSISNFFGRDIEIIKLNDVVNQKNYNSITKSLDGGYDSYTILNIKAYIVGAKENNNKNDYESSLYLKHKAAFIDDIVRIENKNYHINSIETLKYGDEKIDMLYISKSTIEII